MFVQSYLVFDNALKTLAQKWVPLYIKGLYSKMLDAFIEKHLMVHSVRFPLSDLFCSWETNTVNRQSNAFERSLFTTKWLKTPCVEKYCINMCCSCLCPSTCRKLLVDMHPCCHSFVNTYLRGTIVTFSTHKRLHGKMPALWAKMNVLPHSATFWLLTAS